MSEKPRTFEEWLNSAEAGSKGYHVPSAYAGWNARDGEFTPSERNTLRNEGSTHWEDCWRVHIQCAEKKIIARDKEVAAKDHIISGLKEQVQLMLADEEMNDRRIEELERERDRSIFELHRSHRRAGDFNFGVRATICDLTLEEMNNFRKMLVCAIGTAEDMFRREIERRNPVAQNIPSAALGEPAATPERKL